MYNENFTSHYVLTATLEAFDWKSLKSNDLVVDVGGGIGSSTLALAREFPHLRYVVQDRPSTIPLATNVSSSPFFSESFEIIQMNHSSGRPSSLPP